MLSIIIPTYKDQFLQKTIDSLIENAKGEIEIIPVLDGFTPKIPIRTDHRIRMIKLPRNQGMRAAINAGIDKAKGKFIMKCDSHCAFGPGYDKILTDTCAKNWLMVPSRCSLNINTWGKEESRPVRNYYYLSFPVKTKDYGICLSNQGYWPERERARKSRKYDIDDNMTLEGSCWLANKEYFLEHIGPLDDRKETYGTFAEEPQEIGLKYWLGGGQIKVNKKTWYAHLVKRGHHYKANMFVRDYKVGSDTARSRTWSAKHWMNNEEPGMIYPFSWLVERFWPVRTWPTDKNLWVLPK